MNQRERNDLDLHITGNYGEDQLREEDGMCIWDDCGSDAIYCEAHAREYMQPDIDALRSRNAELVKVLQNLLQQIMSIEVLGEWSALDINPRQSKITRAKVEQVLSAARALLTKAPA